MTENKILLVGLDSFLGKIYFDNFSGNGFVVFWEMNESSAIERARSFAPDVVIVDITNNNIDVDKFVDKLDKAVSDLNSTEKFFLTDHCSNEKESFGNHRYLSKHHFYPSEIVEKIKFFLTNKKKNGNN